MKSVRQGIEREVVRVVVSSYEASRGVEVMAKGSRLEYALLGLLKQGEKSGYDLRKMFATTPMRHFSDSPGSIYPALRRMQERGWLESASELGNGRGRQVFGVTERGREELLSWLRQGVTREDVIWRSEEMTLRFAFMGGNVERAVTLRFLEELERETAAYIVELREYAKNFGPDIQGSTGVLAFECGIEGYEAQRAWAHRAKTLFAEAAV